MSKIENTWYWWVCHDFPDIFGTSLELLHRKTESAKRKHNCEKSSPIPTSSSKIALYCKVAKITEGISQKILLGLAWNCGNRDLATWVTCIKIIEKIGEGRMLPSCRIVMDCTTSRVRKLANSHEGWRSVSAYRTHSFNFRETCSGRKAR